MYKDLSIRTLLLTAINASLIAYALSSSPSASYYLVRDLTRYLNKNRLPGQDGFSESAVRMSLYRMKKKGEYRLVTNKKARSYPIELTKKGKRALWKSMKPLRIPEPARWDGRWRFAIFDVPEKSRYTRDALREKLRQLNFFQIQKSVWVHPYPCTKEIEHVAELYHAEQYLLLFEGTVNRDEKLRSYFKRKGFTLPQ
ncbi:MAG: hypothetical protein WD850_00055 [Candidatus Spechtbacterales bacterium]